MLIHDASGAVAVVSAESVRIVGEGCIVLNARAVKCTGRIAFSANEINELAELLHVSADVLLGRVPLEVA